MQVISGRWRAILARLARGRIVTRIATLSRSPAGVRRAGEIQVPQVLALPELGLPREDGDVAVRIDAYPRVKQRIFGDGSLAVLKRCVDALEANATYVAVTPCEPQLGPRGLYPTMSTRDSGQQVRAMMNLLAYADGRHDLIAIADAGGIMPPKSTWFEPKLRDGLLVHLI